MSQRELLIILAHTHVCEACRSRLLVDPEAVLAARPLTPAERESLSRLKPEDYATADSLGHAAGIAADDLQAFRSEAVVRLRHL